MRRFLQVLLFGCLGGLSCVSSPTEDVGTADQHWDSADGNPTHPTHSTMAEIAVSTVRAEYPEVSAYETSLVDGANKELHDLVEKDPALEALRLEVGGNNWAGAHPEVLWQKARAAFALNDRPTAYWYVGMMMHYAQDMGVPAHAFHVYHQSGLTSWDNLELLGFFDFHADMNLPPPVDPQLENPLDYIEWSAQSARDHFNTAFPGKTYARTFFPQAYADMTDEDWTFVKTREASATWVSAYILRSAARAFRQP